MAFFKFRLSDQTEQTDSSTEAVPVGIAENIEAVRRRARHRLIGAVVLVFGAVIVFPMLFDAQPRPVALNMPIVIPDRQGAQAADAVLASPSAPRPAAPALPDQPPLPASAGLDADEQVVAATQPTPKPALGEAAAAKAEAVKAEAPQPSATPAAALSPPAPPVEKPAPVNPPKTEQVAKPKDDGSKAKSLLDGKPVTTAGRHILQVGAFSDAAKVREVRQKLQQAGVTTYTQVITGNDGKSTTRVRVGPFESREEAEKVAARVRKLGLSPALLKL
jgi:DedD protein